MKKEGQKLEEKRQERDTVQTGDLEGREEESYEEEGRKEDMKEGK